MVSQDATGLNADAESAARVTDELGLTWTVLGDYEAAWIAAWGADDDNVPQHSYTLVDAEGRLLWRLADGAKTSVEEVESVVNSALP